MNSPGHFPSREEYKNYMTSAQWRMRKEAFFAKVGKRCQACRSTKGIVAHHATYENFGHERPGDLMALCQPCHKQLHREKKLIGRKMTLKAFSLQFVRTKRKKI